MPMTTPGLAVAIGGSREPFRAEANCDATDE